jgi:hypothetical protein
MQSKRLGRMASCSFCKKKIAKDGIDIIDFHFHKACANSIFKTLGMVKKYGEWRAAHPQELSPEITR